MSDEALIYTTRGNVPVASLAVETTWEVAPTYIKFTERYRAPDGVIVRDSTHICALTGVGFDCEAGKLNG